ncbi:phytanoyl-CoA dioxygenase family protein [Tellurirhabdus rosea]|uniref:phytanoyl-CoA dioxygenase family protein n=1 Tax=Tellurirhabdus rosea TaxID=2674997 RepID=UPI002259D584|nr:phytanoyl-CoA dioxygenase family protein [Tellurirhabdus rosea]
MPTAVFPQNYTVNLPWVESPFFKKELKSANLDPETEKMVTQFAEEGYVVFDPEIDFSVLDEVIASLEEKHLATSNLRIQDAWAYAEAVRQIAIAPKVMDLLRVLYRREPIPFQTLNFKLGTQQRTHSDSIHFHSIPQRFMCGVWVALEDVRDDNGPLHYYPGSQKLPFYDLVDMGLKGTTAQTIEEVYGKTYIKYEDFLEDMIQAQGLKKSILNMKKGQAIIWSANLLHGGEKIKTPGATRYSQVTHYFFEDCVYYTPLRSDATLDKLFIRQIMNIATRKVVENKYMDQTLNQAHEGYPLRFTVPKTLLSLSRLIPAPVKKILKR